MERHARAAAHSAKDKIRKANVFRRRSRLFVLVCACDGNFKWRCGSNQEIIEGLLQRRFQLLQFHRTYWHVRLTVIKWRCKRKQKSSTSADTLAEPSTKESQMIHAQNTTVQTATQAPALVWLVDYSGELVNEARTGTRSSDGRFLKKHCKLNAKRRTDDFNEMLAQESYDNAA